MPSRYHLDWLINSQCDWTCQRCQPPATSRPDLSLADRRAALESFVAFAGEGGLPPSIAFYPRQAAWTDAFTEVLRATAAFKSAGRVGTVSTVNRGDLPADKIDLLARSGVDRARVTIDGPEPVQDALRRPGSHRDTMESFRRLRDAGLRVEPLMLVVRFNAAHVAETMTRLWADGFSDFVLQVGIRSAAKEKSSASRPAGHGNSLWNESLSAGEFRDVLRVALEAADALGPAATEFRQRFILRQPMFARLFFELGRGEEYRRLVGSAPAAELRFSLSPAGDVSVGPDAGVKLGSFPGGSFDAVYRSAPALQAIDCATYRIPDLSRSAAAFERCLACPAAAYCPPKLATASATDLTFRPDEHCWVASAPEGSGQ